MNVFDRLNFVSTQCTIVEICVLGMLHRCLHSHKPICNVDNLNCYFEIAQKTSQKQPLITKWKLLSQLAQNKNGQFVIFTPHGHKSFAQTIVEEHHITARLVAI